MAVITVGKGVQGEGEVVGSPGSPSDTGQARPSTPGSVSNTNPLAAPSRGSHSTGSWVEDSLASDFD